LYGASALVFFGVVLRDYIWKIYFPSESEIIFQSLTLATALCIIPVNWLLFGAVNKGRMKIINSMIAFIFLASIILDLGSKSKYSLILTVQIIASGVLGRHLYVSGKLFCFRSRDFFLNVLGILVVIVGFNFQSTVCLSILIIMIGSFALSMGDEHNLEKSVIRTLSITESLAAILPSILFMMLTYYMYESGLANGLAYELRFASYANSLCLVGIPLIPIMKKEQAEICKKLTASIILVLVLILVLLCIYEYVLMAFMDCGLTFAMLSYYILIKVCLKNNEIRRL
jgi:chromate transport protein ChrA